MAAPALEAVTAASFILATEVWIPGPSGDVLLRADGVYGPLKPFEASSDDYGFSPCEGLPGRAWKEGRPIILTDLSDPAFLRAAPAAEAGLAAAAAIPVFSGAALKGVLVLFCGRDDTHVGAIEIWRGEGDAMSLEAGFYGAAAAFREVSEKTEFRRGQGLPGGVWAAGAPMLMRDLGSSAGFVRSASAKAAGLTTGLGVPVATPAGAYVLTLLSGRATPIARRFELWEVAPARGGRQAAATLADGLCDVEGPLWQTERKLSPWQGSVGRAMATGAPVAEANPAGAVRYAGMVALPQHAHGEVARVVAWYF
jgi:GAF domain